MKNILCIILIFSLTGCFKISKSTWDFSKPGSPQMRWIYDGPPAQKSGKPYPPLYTEGWVDGCETGAAGNTNAFYKYTLHFRQDAIKAQDDIYYKGWKDAFFYCGRYIYQYNRRIGF
jgi:hypothetical protein